MDEARNIKWRTRLRNGVDMGMRLRGGGATDTFQLKSPFQECKVIMDQFDDILAAYKKALGPCGETTCPYAQNIIEQICKQKCDGQGVPQAPPMEEETCDPVPCEWDECPYKEKKNNYPAGCGSPNCAYTKYKLGLVDDDAALELQFLPPAVSGRCGHPKCEYPFEPELPPIHWDCPDPLPKGTCRNQNCPFQPPDLKKLKVPEKKTGPCGSPHCPYAIPDPCGVPSCPFRRHPCPFLEEKAKVNDVEKEDGQGELCGNPDCPDRSKKGGSGRKKGKKEKKKKMRDSEDDLCSNPHCPYASDREKKKKRKEKRKDNTCSNPECPYASDKKKSRKPKKDHCSNPDCPYASSTSTSTSSSSSSDRFSTSSDAKTCDNPSCPYMKSAASEDPICQDPACPLGQPLASCGMQDCPYEPKPSVEYCPSPNCPWKKRKNMESTSSSSCTSPSRPDRNGSREVTNKEDYNVDATVETVTETIIEDTIMDLGGGGDQAVGVGADSQGLVAKKKKSKKNKAGFAYGVGDRYPGMKIGHKECVVPSFRVPPKMGWMWNIFTPILNLKPRRGWRPGAVQKTIAARIRAHRMQKGLGQLTLPRFRGDHDSDYSDGEDVKVVPKPTLHVQKRCGEYMITMNPLKDPKTLADNENPYMDCTPVQFKITKNKRDPPDETEDGCFCDEDDDVSSTSSSELDIEFTPPAGIIHPERFKKKKNVIHCDTQYDPVDFAVPKKPDKKQQGKGKKGKGDGKKGGKKGGKKDAKKGKGGKKKK